MRYYPVTFERMDLGEEFYFSIPRAGSLVWDSQVHDYPPGDSLFDSGPAPRRR